MEYLSLSQYLKNTFGCKVYKIAIDGGFTCPNRDGTIGTGGCIFCSGHGSGDFASSRELSITEQIEEAKAKVSRKIKNGMYIAYFQAFTNTYAPVDVLRAKFTEAINHPDICAISIGTRPDCLPNDVLDLLYELNKIKPVWVELGLQTIHEKSAEFVRRGYPLSTYDKAINDLMSHGIYVVTHVILGLPGETEEMMLETVKYVCKTAARINPDGSGIKLQLLHIIEGTDLSRLYLNTSNQDIDNLKQTFCYTATDSDIISYASKVMSTYSCMTLEEYASIVKKCVEIIPKNIAIHRMTGDGDKKTLIAPLWSGDKKKVLNTINSYLRD